MASAHFRVPGRELLFGTAEVCPFYGGLTFDGVAVEEIPGRPDRLHLIVSTGTARAYLGPDRSTVGRRALILVTALMGNPQPLPAERAGEVLDWLAAAWDSSAETIRELATLRRWTLEPGP